jgi:hypothetical protein
MIQQQVLALVKKNIFGFHGCHTPQISSVLGKKNNINIISHELAQSRVGDLDIAKKEQLVELICKKGMINRIPFFNQ